MAHGRPKNYPKTSRPEYLPPPSPLVDVRAISWLDPDSATLSSRINLAFEHVGPVMSIDGPHPEVRASHGERGLWRRNRDVLILHAAQLPG
jgi:hypothetical protein